MCLILSELVVSLHIKFTIVTSNFILDTFCIKADISFPKLGEQEGLLVDSGLEFYLLFTSTFLSQEFKERHDSSSLSFKRSVLSVLLISHFPL